MAAYLQGAVDADDLVVHTRARLMNLPEQDDAERAGARLQAHPGGGMGLQVHGVDPLDFEHSTQVLECA